MKIEPMAYQVYCYLVDNSERVVSRLELLEAVWGERPEMGLIDSRKVNVHVARLREWVLIDSHRGFGYRLA